ncbi:MAG: aminopeptidase [Bacteroides sp.]|nr:aminopeptidase [Prevotella sp.]MCM1406873.1 aminopeptidase [Treponema brennaborense]MCM1470024.1 aminopeptidase [Bacteroides sp.]
MNTFNFSDLSRAARTVISEVCACKKNERVLIITNPSADTEQIGSALFAAAREASTVPALIYQEEKTLLDYADPAVIAAIGTNPDIVLSISANKLGKDEQAMKNPYTLDDGSRRFPHIFDYLLDGKKTLRAVWTPGITCSMFSRTVCIDYALLAARCEALMRRLTSAQSVHVTAPGGTDITVPIAGRTPMADDGNFSKPGSGGNIPAGEVFISPVVGGCQGTIVFDGSMSLTEGDIVISDPIIVSVKDGFVCDIASRSKKPLTFESCEAGRLLASIAGAEERALQMEQDGKLPAGQGAVYKRNARNIGELGIGLNPEAQITGNMLEDEKAFRTCHFAIGANYDGDAESLIHLDGVVRSPTITVHYADGSSCVIEKDGVLTDSVSV